MSTIRFSTFAIAILLAGFCLRAVVANWWQDRLDASGQQFGMGDSEGYWVLAKTIVAGEAYQYNGPDASVFRTPIYPWMLSWVIRTSRPERAVRNARYFGSALGMLAVGIGMGVVARYYDRVAALVFGGLTMCYPGGVTTSVLVLAEAPFMPMMFIVLSALALANRCPTHSMRWTAVAGVVSGIAILTRPSWLLFMPFYYAIRILGNGQRLREFKHAVVAGICIAIVMSPWWVRNYQVTGHFVLTTLQVGASLYDGLHPGATGASDTGMVFSGKFAERLRAEDGRSEGELGNFEYRLNARLASAAAAWAIANPTESAILAAKKIARTWTPVPSAAELPGGWPVRVAFAVGMLGIVVPAGWHLLRRRSLMGLGPFVVPALYFTLLHAIFVGSIRYRQPAVFALAVFAAPELVEWFRAGMRLRLTESPGG
jgi:hypothetical protein